MGKNNVIVNHYFADKERFADLFNVEIFGGKQVVSPEDLVDMDTKALRISSTENMYEEFVRDQLKQWKYGARLLVLGLEPENSVHYALPIKLMKYESIQYEKNYSRIQKRHRKEKDLNQKEYISGFGKSDYLEPVITIALYHGNEEWDAPVSLQGMMSFESMPEEIREEVRNYCNDFHVNLVDVNHLDGVDKFKTDLREVFGFLLRQNDKEALKDYIESNENFRHLKEDTYDVIMALSNTREMMVKKEKYSTEGGYNMCLAIREWGEEERAAGRQEGRQEGEMLCLITLAMKKKEKGLSVKEIADLLEEREDLILKIFHASENVKSGLPEEIYCNLELPVC